MRVRAAAIGPPSSGPVASSTIEVVKTWTARNSECSPEIQIEPPLRGSREGRTQEASARRTWGARITYSLQSACQTRQQKYSPPTQDSDTRGGGGELGRARSPPARGLRGGPGLLRGAWLLRRRQATIIDVTQRCAHSAVFARAAVVAGPSSGTFVRAHEKECGRKKGRNGGGGATRSEKSGGLYCSKQPSLAAK